MAKHSHLTLSERIEIEKALRDRASFSEIGAITGKDPSTISKEVRNHVIIKDGGSRDWLVLRVGADFKLCCLGCGREVMGPRTGFEKNVRQVRRDG